MPLIPQGNFTFLHSNQPDNLSSIMSPSQVKSSFDSQALELKTTLNNAIALLGSVASNDSGAKAIGLEAVAGVTGANVQAAIANLKTQIDTKMSLTGNKTVSGTITMAGDIIGTGYTIDFSSVRIDGVRITDTFLPFTGGTLTGGLTVNLASSAGANSLVLKNSLDNTSLNFKSTGSKNYIQSANYANTASQNLEIGGYLGNILATLTLNATTVTGIGTLNATTLQEGGTNLTSKYLSLSGAFAMTGALTTPSINTTSGTSTINSGAQTVIAQMSNANGTTAYIGASGINALQSGNAAFNAVQNFKIEGYNGLAIPTLTLNATTVNVTGTLQEGGTALTAKYAQLGANTFTASQTVSSGGITISEGTISAGSATNDGRIRTAQTATLNYIQSGNNAGSAPKNLTISGYGATTMNECNIVCNTFKIAGQPLQSGMVTITPVANTPTKVTVTFPVAYSAAPHVIVTAESGVIGSQVMGASVANITATQCDIYVYRNNTNSTNVHWIAMA